MTGRIQLKKNRLKTDFLRTAQLQPVGELERFGLINVFL